MIIELELKNKILNEENNKLKLNNSNNESELLLNESLHTLNILRTKVRILLITFLILN